MNHLATNDACLSSYFKSMKSIKLLTREEEDTLSKKIATGDQDARRRLVEANLRLVVRIARSMWNPSLSLIDLIQEGNIGLLKATERFDGGRQVKFSTYAAWWIRQAISRSLVNTERTIRLPHRKEELIKKAHAEKSILSQTLKRQPTTKEISDKLGVDPKQLDDVLFFSEKMGSFEAATDQDSPGLLDLYEDFTYAPERAFDKLIVKEQTRHLLSLLQARERDVLSQRFELEGSGRVSLKKMGGKMGLSPETVRHIEKNALKKLQAEASKGYLCLSA
ncbi:MAG: RNA polymerase sigma factor RpoD/SigA [Spirochaetes bacterium]|nr:RNA polymerase sigma factor RpoD/SigA [Spirochaetota bacterium]